MHAKAGVIGVVFFVTSGPAITCDSFAKITGWAPFAFSQPDNANIATTVEALKAPALKFSVRAQFVILPKITAALPPQQTVVACKNCSQHHSSPKMKQHLHLTGPDWMSALTFRRQH